MNEWACQDWWNGTDRRRVKYSSKNLSQCYTVDQMCHMGRTGISLGLQGDSLVTNCMKHGMVTLTLARYRNPWGMKFSCVESQWFCKFVSAPVPAYVLHVCAICWSYNVMKWKSPLFWIHHGNEVVENLRCVRMMVYGPLAVKVSVILPS